MSGFTPISTVHSREKYDGGTIGRRSHVNVLATPAAASSLIGVRHYSWTELEITGGSVLSECHGFCYVLSNEHKVISALFIIFVSFLKLCHVNKSWCLIDKPNVTIACPQLVVD